MIFSELYSAYYHTVAEILKRAAKGPLGEPELRNLVEQNAFGESILRIPSAFREERWQLLKPDGTTILNHAPSMPLTLLQKQWLKAISLDPRIRLFGDWMPDFPDVEPLFLPEDMILFDQYTDGDHYTEETYIANFRRILDAIKNRYPLQLEIQNRRGKPVTQVLMPEYLEYSEKDDKFRLIGSGNPLGGTINLGRIVSCRPYESADLFRLGKRNPVRQRRVILELEDRRNALERVLLHFAHFQKQAEKIGSRQYRITVYYEKEDETELVIRVLSFGPVIKVAAPDHFVNLIKKRLMDQKSCER